MSDPPGVTYRELHSILSERGLSEVFVRLNQESSRESSPILGALKLALPALDEDPQQLAAQLLGRLSQSAPELLGSFLEEARVHGRGLLPQNQSLRHPEHPQLMTLRGHSAPVLDLALLPEGRRLLSASSDGSVVMWDLFQRERHQLLSSQWSQLRMLRMSHSGSLVAVVEEHPDISLWSLEPWRIHKRFKGHQSPLCDMLFAADDRMLLSLEGQGTWIAWSVATGNQIKANSQARHGRALAANSLLAATSHGDGLRLWDLRTFRCLALLELGDPRQAPHSLSFSPDGKALAGVSELQTQVWSVPDLESLHVLPHATQGPCALAWSDGGNALLTADGALRIWDLERGALAHTLRGHRQRICALQLSAQGGTAFTSSEDHSIRVWSLDVDPRALAPGHHAASIQAILVGSGLAISTCADGSIDVWDLASGRCLHGLEVHARLPGLHASFCPTSRRMAVLSCRGEEAWIQLWDAEEGCLLDALSLPKGYLPTGLSLAMEGRRVLIAGCGRFLLSWDPEAGSLAEFRGKKLRVVTMALSPNGAFLATASSQPDGSSSLELWDVESRQKVFTRNLKRGQLSSLCWLSHEPKVLVGTSEGTLYLWDTHKGRSLRPLHGHKSEVCKVRVSHHRAFSLDRAGQLMDWDLEHEGCRGILPLNDIVDFDLSEQARLVTATRREVALWELHPREGATRKARFHGDQELLCCAVSPDGATALAGERGGGLHILRYRPSEA